MQCIKISPGSIPLKIVNFELKLRITNIAILMKSKYTPEEEFYIYMLKETKKVTIKNKSCFFNDFK